MSDAIPEDIMDTARKVAMKIAAVLPVSGSEDVNHIAEAIFAERQRIIARLKEEADLTPCSEDAMVTRSNARLIEADFSYEEAERLLEIEEAREKATLITIGTGGDHG